MPSLRRGVRSGDYGDGAPLRETRGPLPVVWNDEYAVNAPDEGFDDDPDFADGFSFVTIAPQVEDSNEHAITRGEYYRLRYGETAP